MVQVLIDNYHVDADIQTSRGVRPLMQAARHGHNIVIQHLLEKGADVTATTAQGRSALYMVVFHGMYDSVELLLRGVETKCKDNVIRSQLDHLLRVAAQQGHASIAKMLLTRGANVNSADKSKKTALHLAAGGKNTEVVRLLLAAGAEVSVRDRSGSTPLLEATHIGDEDAVQVLQNEALRQS